MLKPKIFSIILSIGVLSGLVPLTSYHTPEKVSAVGPDITSIHYMQDMTPEICANTTIGVSTTLYDIRDGSDYLVSKLIDGKCWMTQNLRLTRESLIAKYKAGNDIQSSDDNTIPASAYTLSPDTSDIARTNTKFQLPTPDPSQFTDSDENRNNPRIAYNTSNETELKTYGAYYNWNAATAGTGKMNVTSGNTRDSICPKGWRLPTGGSGGEFEQLGKSDNDNRYSDFGAYSGDSDSIYTGTTGRWFGSTTAGASGAAFFPAAGAYGNGGALSSPGSYGNYWSSTARNASYAYFLFMDSNRILPANDGVTYIGRSVRCIARDRLEDRADVSIIAVKVTPYINLDVASDPVRIDADPNKISHGSIKATVSANTEYQLLLSSTEPDLTLKSTDGAVTDTSQKIIASDIVKEFTSTWGIKNSDDTYKAITTSPLSTYYSDKTTSSSGLGFTHTFTVGVSVAPSLPSGEYSTTVTVTAANI